MTYGVGDIIRFNDNDRPGLYEISGTCEDDDEFQYTVTNDECNSEYFAKHDDIIFVCSIYDRKDLEGNTP